MPRTTYDASLSVNVERSTLDRARAAVAALRGSEHAVPGGMSGLVDRALVAALDRLEAEHNGGRPFPEVDGLQRGRAR